MKLSVSMPCRNMRSVGTPTWQHISFLCHTTHSILHLSSQQNSDPHTKSDCNYFSILHHSNTPSLLSLSIRPFLGATSMGNCSTSHTYQLANGRPSWTAGDQYKRGCFPSCDHSLLATVGVHIKRGIISFDTSRRKKQRLTARPRCLADRALHSSAEAMTIAALGPLLNQLHQEAHQHQATSPQMHFNHGITAPIYNTLMYDF